MNGVPWAVQSILLSTSLMCWCDSAGCPVSLYYILLWAYKQTDAHGCSLLKRAFILFLKRRSVSHSYCTSLMLALISFCFSLSATVTVKLFCRHSVMHLQLQRPYLLPSQSDVSASLSLCISLLQLTSSPPPVSLWEVTIPLSYLFQQDQSDIWPGPLAYTESTYSSSQRQEKAVSSQALRQGTNIINITWLYRSNLLCVQIYNYLIHFLKPSDNFFLLFDTSLCGIKFLGLIIYGSITFGGSVLSLCLR